MKTFKNLSNIHPQVLYPSLATDMFLGDGVKPGSVEGEMMTFLSLNRFERKKNVGLSIRAFAKLGNIRARLVIAGGYDNRVIENTEHFKELEKLASEEGVSERVVFLRSPSDQEKLWLLKITNLTRGLRK